jgi:hypothetical protein
MTRKRLIVAAGLIAFTAAGTLTGAAISGQLNATFEMERTPFGPTRLGIDGSVGEKRSAVAPEVPKVVLMNGGEPYHGPTQEELDALNDVRAATLEAWQASRRAMQGRGLDNASVWREPPIVALPGRRLTQFEIDELHRTAARLRGSDVPSPPARPR